MGVGRELGVSGDGFRMKLLHLRLSGIRFSQGVPNLDPSHVHFPVGFALLWKSNAAKDLTGGRAQVLMLPCLLLTSYWAAPFLTSTCPCQWGEGGTAMIKNLYSEYMQNSYDSIIKRQITQLKSGLSIWVDISPKKINKWPVSPCKDAQHPNHQGNQKGNANQTCD